MLGASLALLPVETFDLAALLAGLRIGLGVAIGVVIAPVFGLGGSARAIVILQCAMPPAVYNYLFAQRWNNQPEEVASVVVVATFASIVSVPALLRFLMQWNERGRRMRLAATVIDHLVHSAATADGRHMALIMADTEANHITLGIPCDLLDLSRNAERGFGTRTDAAG